MHTYSVYDHSPGILLKRCLDVKEYTFFIWNTVHRPLANDGLSVMSILVKSLACYRLGSLSFGTFTARWGNPKLNATSINQLNDSQTVFATSRNDFWSRFHFFNIYVNHFYCHFCRILNCNLIISLKVVILVLNNWIGNNH